MSDRSEVNSMAVFCDFENVALGVRDAEYEKFNMTKVLERLLLKGSIVVKKAYCDWERYKSFKAAMHEASFELIEIPHVRQSGKNSADIRLVVDALDLCYTKGHVDTFVIISGDSDFSPLVSKLRENNKTVIGVGVKNSTSDLLIANCDEFIYYDDLVREQRRRAPARRGAKSATKGAGRDTGKPADRENGKDAKGLGKEPGTGKENVKEGSNELRAPGATDSGNDDAGRVGEHAATASAAAAPTAAAKKSRSRTAVKKTTARGRKSAQPQPAAAAVTPPQDEPATPAASWDAEIPSTDDDEIPPSPFADAASSPRPESTEDDRRQRAIDLVLETLEGLIAERGADETVWGSMVKQTLKRRQPGFNESYYGFRSFNALLEEAQTRGLVALTRDDKSGGFKVRLSERVE